MADAHNILLNGGVFGYPSNRKNKNGKIRYLYEALPISMIIENAKGKSINENGIELLKEDSLFHADKSELMDKESSDFHKRIPLYFGSKDLIEVLQASIHKEMKEESLLNKENHL